jgi:hypothetical protein
MNWKTIFDGEKENPFFTKLKKVNSREKFADKIISAFYLGGLVYSKENHEKILKAISANELSPFLKEAIYNTLENNLELYYIQEASGQAKIIVIVDYLELYQNEEVIEVIPCNGYLNIPVGEKIYP